MAVDCLIIFFLFLFSVGALNMPSGSESEGEFEPQFLENADQKLLTQAMHSYAHAAQYYMQVSIICRVGCRQYFVYCMLYFY